MAQNQISQKDYAGFWKRVAAAVLDFIILTVVFFVIGLIFNYNPFTEMGKAAQQHPGVQPTPPSPPAIVSIINIIGTWLYYALFESSHLRGTPGKIALSIITANAQGQALDFGAASLRYALRMLFGIMALMSALQLASGVVTLIDVLFVAFTPRSQALHDMLAGTLVLNKNLESETF